MIFVGYGDPKKIVFTLCFGFLGVGSIGLGPSLLVKPKIIAYLFKALKAEVGSRQREKCP